MTEPTPARDTALEPILLKLEEGTPPYLTTEACCRLIQRIKQSVMLRSSYNDAASGKDKLFQHGAFEREDKVLAGLLGTLAFSARYVGFFESNADTLGATMARRYKMRGLTKDWPTWDRDRRVSLMDEVSALQLDLFSHSNLRFTPVPVQAQILASGVLGEFRPGKFPLSNRVKDKEILVDNNLIDASAPVKVMRTLWHENTHSLCQQFAAACDSGLMEPYNPFLTDAETVRQRHKYDTYMTQLLPRAYKADPEEALAFGSSDRFVDAWTNNSDMLKLALLRLGL